MYELSTKKDHILLQNEGFDQQRRQSMKGLFTFYREQQQLQEKYQQILITKKAKIEEKAKLIAQNNQSKANEKPMKKQKSKLNKNRSSKLLKVRSSKDAKKYQNNFHSSKNDGKSLSQQCKLTRHNTDKKTISKKQIEHKNKNIIQQDLSDLSYKFLHKIKSKNQIKQTFKKQLQIKNEQDENSQEKKKSKTINVSKLQKYQIKKCFNDRQIQLYQFFRKRNNKISDSKLKLRESQQRKSKQKMLTHEIPTMNDQILKQVSVVILHSPKKRSFRNKTQHSTIQQYEKNQINQQKKNSEEPRTLQTRYAYQMTEQIKQKHQIERDSLNKNCQTKPLKFPFITNKNTIKLKNELRKLTESIGSSQMQNEKEGKFMKYHRNLTEQKQKNKYEFTNKNISISKSKLFCYQQREKQQKDYICVALVDMSKSDVNQIVEENQSWLQRKKLILKKLGLKI